MYVINPAPASQDIQPTASSYVTVHHPGSRESIELEQQQHKEILSQILTKCNADMSEQVANFSCPDEKTPHRPTATVAKDGTKPPTSPTSARPSIASPRAEAERHDSIKPAPEPSSSSSKAPVGEDDTARHGKDGEVRSPPPTVKRSTSPDSSPLSTASSSNAASLSPASSDGPSKPPVKLEPSTDTLAPATNFSSVVHPKERALKSIAAAAASNERNSVVNGGNATAKSSTKFAGTGRTMLNGTSSFPTGTAASIGAGTASGGRLQFFKDGKFILELARAREGEKTSWISVPRKTFWPPTVSSTSANFHKHESSTSLSFSDDNSSIQSSPWQRDHCWKQSNPRPNISKELSLYYFRPLKARGRPSQDTRLRWRRKRRRPYEPNLPPERTSKVQLNAAVESEVVENGNNECKKKETKPSTDENGEVLDCHSEVSNGTTPMDTSEVTQENKEDESGVQNPKRTTPKGQMEDDCDQSNGHHLTPNVTHFRASRWKRSGGKELSAIIKTLIEQQQTKVTNSMTSPAGGGSAVGPFRLGTIAERGSNSGTSFRSSVFSSSAASQHVSPRKRILRELEKVSLDDVGSSGTSSTKRSRPKSGSAVGTPVIVTATTATPLSTLTTNGTGSSLNGSSSSGSSSNSNSSSKTNGHLNGSGSIVNGTTGGPGKQSLNGAGSSLSPASKNATAAPAPVSKPFSSYSITSLLGHSTSSSSGESSSSANSSSSDALQRKADVSVASVTSTASHHHYHHSQHPLSPHQQYQGLTIGSKSPVMTDAVHHAHYQGQLGSNRYGYNNKKRSPSYGGGNGTAASPEATSGGSGSVDPYSNTIRSPDLSPSPEHHHTHQQHSHHSAHQPPHGFHHTPGSVSNSGFSRYRQHPYGGSPSSYSSAPSSSRFSPSPSTNDSATTPPYSGSVSGGVSGGARSAISYRAGYHLSGNGSQGHSPPASNGSPQHYSRASPLNFGRGAHHSPPPPAGSHHHQHNRTAGTSSSSPRASPNGGGVTTSHATTPTSAMASLTTGTAIRTVPKKTAALRQPFSGGLSPSSSSPSRERSNSNASSSSVKKESQPEGSDSVDGSSLGHHYGATPSSPAGVIRPNTVIASPTAHHPVASPYYPLYQTQLSASSSSPSMNATAVAVAAAAAVSAVPFHAASLSYYQQMYTAATMGFRTPFWMHYQGLPGVAPHAPHMVQSPHHHLPSPSSAAPTMQLADRRIIERNPPSPPPTASASSITEPSESHRLQHSNLATPSTTAAALNYSVTALSSSSRDIINGGSAFSSPSGPNWPTDALGYHHHPDLSSRSSVAASGVTSATAKDEPSNGECQQGLRSSYVPLNLSKH
ncbi:protein hairless-like [Anopheles marshallii]|uniref:protein hairless-like n=1 Tax=Anopheles marshallii TaxID=1521116 RepID=UPI00237BCF8D|nr:protein hairless-like [Anopheles marshallii]